MMMVLSGSTNLNTTSSSTAHRRRDVCSGRCWCAVHQHNVGDLSSENALSLFMYIRPLPPAPRIYIAVCRCAATERHTPHNPGRRTSLCKTSAMAQSFSQSFSDSPILLVVQAHSIRCHTYLFNNCTLSSENERERRRHERRKVRTQCYTRNY